jgi:vacuolar protein-sorting-associated protein 4
VCLIKIAPLLKMTDLVNKGKEIIKEAVAKDNEDKLDEALSLYTKGIEYLIAGAKYEKNKKSKDIINNKVQEYLKRAEELKQDIANANAPKKKKAVKTGGGADEKDENGDDADTAKLKGSLAGAIVTETPNVKWEDVAGLETAKSLLKEAVLLPIKFPQLFVGKRKPWKGILLYGPPGTGKSFLAKAVATEAGASTFFSVSSSDLVSKFQGESEKLVRNLFEMARAKRPSIVFIDEIDSLCGNRSDGENDSARRIKTEFLVQMQGVGKSNDGILVLGATNTPWDLDPAIRRRFEKRVYIPLPEPIARRQMFKIHIGDTPIEDNLDFDELADKTEGFSGSDISVVVRDALMQPIRRMSSSTYFKKMKNPDSSGPPEVYFPCKATDKGAEKKSLMEIDGDLLGSPKISMQDFEDVLETAKPSVSQNDIVRQEEWTAEFGQEGS